MKIPSSIMSLIHHSKLNERGWWEKTIRNIIIGVIAEKGNIPVNRDEIIDRLRKNGIEIDVARFDVQLSKLGTNKELISTQDNKYLVEEKVLISFKESFEEQTNIEEYSKQKFSKLSNIYAKELDANFLWNEFNEKLLIPLVKEHGAKIHDFVNVNNKRIHEFYQFEEFIKSFTSQGQNIASIVINFLDPSDKKIRSFILRYLNSYFFVEASNLKKSALTEIYHLAEAKSQLDVYIDSNFLFSLLDLHENGYNEASQALLQVIKDAKDRITVQFYLLPTTFEEVQKVVNANRYNLKNFPLNSLNLITRAAEAIPYGFKNKYYEKCKKAGMKLDIDQYFEPYDRNLLTTIKSLGILIDNNDYSDFIDNIESSLYLRINEDTLDQRTFRIEQLKRNGRFDNNVDVLKLYDKILHDMRLWHIVASKRNHLSTPRSVRHWIITLDNKLSAYDWHKQRNKHNQLNICLQPSDLMNMLQFWLPRSEKLENAIFTNFKLPLMFKDYEEETEKVTLSILGAIALHEGSENLTQQTIIEYETNNTIRNKVQKDSTIEQIAELITEYDKLKVQQVKEDYDKLNKEKEILKKENIEAEENRKNEIKKAELEKNELRLSQKEKGKNDQKVELENRLKEKNETHYLLIVQKNKAEERIEKKLKSFSWKRILGLMNPKEVRESILSDYPSLVQLESVERDIKELKKKIQYIENPLIICCENKNDKLFNFIDLSEIRFVGISNSHDIFMRAKSGEYAVRDKDLLTEIEVERLRKKFPKLIVLEYYCFENYLYHPENLKEAIGVDFCKETYISKVKNQIIQKRGNITPKISDSRKGYQEIKEEKIRDVEANSTIYNFLHSDDFEKMYKYFSAKDDLDISIIGKSIPSEVDLVSTDWFKSKISNLVKPRLTE